MSKKNLVFAILGSAAAGLVLVSTLALGSVSAAPAGSPAQQPVPASSCVLESQSAPLLPLCSDRDGGACTIKGQHFACDDGMGGVGQCFCTGDHWACPV